MKKNERNKLYRHNKRERKIKIGDGKEVTRKSEFPLTYFKYTLFFFTSKTICSLDFYVFFEFEFPDFNVTKFKIEFRLIFKYVQIYWEFRDATI